MEFPTNPPAHPAEIAPRAAQGRSRTSGRGSWPNPHDPPEEEAQSKEAIAKTRL